MGLKNQRGYYWRSSLQEPVALLWILPLCFLLGTVIPVMFFAVHLAMDYSMSYEKMPFFPYSTRVTRGWLVKVPDKLKEGVVAAALLCMNLIAFFARR